MKQELEQSLILKYPHIFQDVDKPMQVSCMYWGIAVGDGWFNILSNVCEKITEHENTPEILEKIKNKEYDKVKAQQIKEKFGGLRFYISGGDEKIRSFIDEVEKSSWKICEECSQPGKQTKSGWIRTLCEKCADERYKKRPS